MGIWVDNGHGNGNSNDTRYSAGVRATVIGPILYYTITVRDNDEYIIKSFPPLVAQCLTNLFNLTLPTQVYIPYNYTNSQIKYPER